MAQYTNQDVKAFLANSANIPAYSRLKLVINSGVAYVDIAAAADRSIGEAVEQGGAVGTPLGVRLRNAQGTHIFIGSAAITAGNLVYTDAAGQVGNTNTNAVVGTALQTTTAAGAVLEVLPVTPIA